MKLIRLWQRILVNENLTWNAHGKHYNKVWSSKLLAKIWLGNIINAIYVHFRLPKIKKISFCEISFPKSIVYSDVVRDKLGRSYKSFFPTKTRTVKLWKLMIGIPFARSWCFQDFWITRNYKNRQFKVVCRKKISCKTWKFLDDYTKYHQSL